MLIKKIRVLKETANNLINKTQIKNHKAKLEKQSNPYGYVFECVSTLKQETDEDDEYLIYSINKTSEYGKPLYVFKASKFLLSLALRLDRNEDDYLSKEWVFFDGSHKRCRGFKTVTVAFYLEKWLKY